MRLRSFILGCDFDEIKNWISGVVMKNSQAEYI